MAKDTYWFQHDQDAHADPKILRLVSSRGWEGYGVFWAIVETLRGCDEYKLPVDAVDGLCWRLRIDRGLFDELVEIGLLSLDMDFVFSKSLLRRMEKWDAKKDKCRASASLGGIAKAQRLTSECVANATANAAIEKLTMFKSGETQSTERKKLNNARKN